MKEGEGGGPSPPSQSVFQKKIQDHFGVATAVTENGMIGPLTGAMFAETLHCGKQTIDRVFRGAAPTTVLFH